MKKSMTGLALILALLCALSAAPAALAARTGSGTAADPYVVDTWSDLEYVTNQYSDDSDEEVYVKLGGTETVIGGDRFLSISYNRNINLDLNGHTLDRGLSDPTGGGCVIEVLLNGTLTLEDSKGGGKITGGYDDSGVGGGVVVMGGTFIMEGGTITGNRNNCKKGGGAGVTVRSPGTFIMKGGEVIGNTGFDGVGGVIVIGYASFRISGTPKITGNYNVSNGSRTESNVDLYKGEGIIGIDGPLLDGAKVGVTISEGTSSVSTTGVFTSGLKGNGDASNFTSDNEKFRVDLTATGEAVLMSNVLIKRTITFKVVNGSWNDGTKADKIVVLSCYDDEDTALKLDPKDIPAVGSRPAKGYKAGSWDKTPDTDSRVEEDLTYTYAYREAPIYEVTSGDGQIWIRGDGNTKGASFTFKGYPNDGNTFANFTGIRVNGVDVSEKKYAAEPGSVVVTLKADYLEGLKDGSHKLTAVFTDGEADAGFKVAQSPGRQPADGGDMPKTGDGSQPVLWGLLAAACAGAVAAIRIRRKKK